MSKHTPAWKEISRRRIEGAIYLSRKQGKGTYDYYCAFYRVSEWSGDEHRERIEMGPAIYLTPLTGGDFADVGDPDWFRVGATAAENLLRHEAAVVERRSKRKPRNKP